VLEAAQAKASSFAGWSSPVARQAHNLKVVSSNLAPATNKPLKSQVDFEGFPFGHSSKLLLGHSWGTPERVNQCVCRGPLFLVDNYFGSRANRRQLKCRAQ
jgi:hypothetical protein